jgi:hypothetical protein
MVISTACLKQSESITPIAPTLTLAQLQREAMMMSAMSAGNSQLSDKSKASVEQSPTDPNLFYLNLKYNITNFDVYDSTDIPNSFEKLSNSFIRALAKIFLRIKGSQTIEIDPIELDLPDLNLDFEIVKSIQLKKVYIEYNKDLQETVNNKASFSFINSFKLNRVGKNKSLLISYQKENNLCNFTCLSFDVADGDVFTLIKNNSESIILKPYLTIGKIPSITELRIDGQVELQIGLKLPF